MPVAVAALHIRDAFGEGDDLAAGAGGHVAVGERHRGGRGLILELGQLGGQAAQFGFPSGAGVVGHVVGHQASQPLMADGAQVPGNIQRMQAGNSEGWGVAEVMQVGRATRTSCSSGGRIAAARCAWWTTPWTCAQRSPIGASSSAA